jgi:hypothetical protein
MAGYARPKWRAPFLFVCWNPGPLVALWQQFYSLVQRACLMHWLLTWAAPPQNPA